MSAANGSPLAFQQKGYAEAQMKVEGAAAKLAKLSKRKRTLAYTLKAIVVFGGIVITAGLKGIPAQLIGILIMVAAGIDLIWSNHRRLLVETEAHYAYEALLENVANTHTQKLGKILSLKRTKPKEAEQQLIELLEQLIVKLNGTKAEIKASLNKADLEALRSLSLDEIANRKGFTP
jgi:hypothetical protein